LKTYIFKQADVYYTPKIDSEISDKKITPEEKLKREDELRKADEITIIVQR